MAVPVVTGDLLQVRYIAYAGNQISVNIVHYLTGAIVGTPDLTLFPQAFDTGQQVQLKACMSNQARYRGVGVRRLNPNPTIEYSTIANDGAGTNVADLLPLEMSGIITKLTGFPGRNMRGRVYVPFPSKNAASASGLVTAAYVVLLSNWGTFALAPQIITTGAGNTAAEQPVVKHHGGFTSTAITAFRANGKFAQQHRRGDFGRPNILPF